MAALVEQAQAAKAVPVAMVEVLVIIIIILAPLPLELGALVETQVVNRALRVHRNLK